MIYEVLYRDEARENARRWKAGREERLRWLEAQLGIDPRSASLSELWAGVVAWYDAGGAKRTMGACPVWWRDEYDVDDRLAMADALSHLFSDEMLRREPQMRLKLAPKSDYGHSNQLVLTLGRWTSTPWGVPRACLEHLRPRAPERTRGESTREDYLEATIERVIRSLDAWKAEMDPATGSVDPVRSHDYADGTTALAALDAGADLWSVERFDEDDEDSHELAVSFDDVFAHGFSAAIDDVVTALQQARIPGAGRIDRPDRELVIIEPAGEGARADAGAVSDAVDRALRAALKTFGPARDE